jgi:hypothetical protein
MIDKLGRRFITDNDNPKHKTLDDIICDLRPDLVDSDTRCEYFLLEVLTRNEQGTYDGFFKGGSTKLTAESVADFKPMSTNPERIAATGISVRSHKISSRLKLYFSTLSQRASCRFHPRCTSEVCVPCEISS